MAAARHLFRMRRYFTYGLGVVAVILALQAALPHRLDEGRSTEVVGKLNHYLKARPRGVALSLLGDAFAWDLACAVKPELEPEAFALQSGIALPRMTLGERGPAWLLVFARGGQAVAVAEIPVSALGGLEQKQPYECVADPGAFLTVVDGPPRRFILRS